MPVSRFVFDFTGVPDYADDTCFVELTDENGAAYDWAGSTFSMVIGRTRGDGAPLVTLTQADGDIVPSVVSGKSRLTFRFRPEKMGDLAAGKYPHSVLRELAGRPTLFGTGHIGLEQAPKP